MEEPTTVNQQRLTKRRRGDSRPELSAFDLPVALEEALSSNPTAERAVLHLIDLYKFDLHELMNKIQSTHPPFFHLLHSSDTGIRSWARCFLH